MTPLGEDAKRVAEIGKVFSKHGFKYLFSRRKDNRLPVRFRQILEELGPTFVKFGQAMSTRPDLFPERYLAELSKLQDEVPPFDPEQAKEIIKEELDQQISELFIEFTAEPVAAASLAQVHRATLNSGAEIAIKVQRPKVAETFQKDINLLYRLARLLERYIGLAEQMRLVDAVEEFERLIKLELDFRVEAKNAQRLRRAFAADFRLKIPRVYYATKHLLILEWLDGIKIDELDKLQEAGYDPKKLARLLAEAYIEQILHLGVFHADPHPGNILVLSQRRLGFLDLGLIGNLGTQDKRHIGELFWAIVRQDVDKIFKLLVKMGIVGDDQAGVKEEVIYFLKEYYGKQLREVKPGRLLFDVISRVVRKYRINPPIRFILLPKTLLTVEALCESLDPEYDWAEVAQAISRRLFAPAALLNNLLTLFGFPSL